MAVHPMFESTPAAWSGRCVLAGALLLAGQPSRAWLEGRLQDTGASSATTARSARMADGREWTTDNLNVDVPGSYCYDDAAANCRRYGRLYTWEVARQVCRTLGEGWRLPTESEWRRLAQHHGGTRGDDARLGSAAFDALLIGGRSGLDAVLGGGRAPDGTYGRLDAHGFYWTASESAPDTAVFYNFGKGSRGLYRQDGGEKSRAFSVRCARD